MRSALLSLALCVAISFIVALTESGVERGVVPVMLVFVTGSAAWKDCANTRACAYPLAGRARNHAC